MNAVFYLSRHDLIVHFTVRRSPSVYVNVAMWEHFTLKSEVLLCAKDYYSNPNIIINFM
jgi:hypothetical protein